MDRPDTDMPLDILFTEILPKLPAKSLMRFKTVSKSFKSQISSPAFASFHRHHSLSSKNRILMVSGTNRTLYSYDLDCLSHIPTLPYSTFRWREGDIRIVSSCNGFLLVNRNTKFPLVLLNPSNRTYIDIPISTDDLVDQHIGFGFDDLSNNYKIALVSNKYNGGDDGYSRQTLIYNVNSKSWKMVDRSHHSEPTSGIKSYAGVLTKNNLIHWITNGRYRPCKITCFDVCTETWKDDVLFPRYYYDPTTVTFSVDIGVLDGCLFSSFQIGIYLLNSNTDIWVMKEYGVQESWTKLLTVCYSFNLHGGVVPVAYRGGDSSEVLLRQRRKSKQVWYNLKDNTMKDAHVHNFWDQQPYICYESLVTLPGAKLFGAFYESDEIEEDQLISFGLIESDLN